MTRRSMKMKRIILIIIEVIAETEEILLLNQEELEGCNSNYQR